MSKKIFTEKEIKLLPANKYVKSVSSKGITYTDEFKHNLSQKKRKARLPDMVSYLCEIAGVSRSGYYNYFSAESQEQRKGKDVEDKEMKEIILKAFNFKNRMTIDLATDTLLKLKKNRYFKKAEDALIHSDQGIHYTHSDS